MRKGYRYSVIVKSAIWRKTLQIRAYLMDLRWEEIFQRKTKNDKETLASKCFFLNSLFVLFLSIKIHNNNNNIGLLLNMTVVNSSTLVTRQWQSQWFGDQRLLLLSTCTMLYYDEEHKLCSLTNTFGCINIQELCEIRNGRFQ